MRMVWLTTLESRNREFIVAYRLSLERRLFDLVPDKVTQDHFYAIFKTHQ